MKKCICYNIEGLLKLLPGFELKQIRTTHESEDDEWGNKGEYYLTNKDNILRVQNYHSLFTSKTVVFNDGSKCSLYSNNVNFSDKDVLRVSKNDFISPILAIGSDYIESTSDLEEWLNFNNVTDEMLETISSTFDVYSVITYHGVSTPSKCGDFWGYSNEPLKLDDREIEYVLNSIEDELLRKKIECILYARVFQKGY